MANENQVNIQEDPSNILGQLVKKGLGTLAKLQEEQITQAFQQGESLDSMAELLQQKSQGQIEQVPQQDAGQALAGQTQAPAQAALQARTQQQATQVPPERTALFGLLRQSPSTRRQELENIKLEQQIRGEVPLQTGELEKLAFNQAKELDRAGRLDANQIFTKFEPVALAFQDSVNSFQRLQASVDDPSPTGDVALIFSFMRLLDPSSVVREGEFAVAEETAGIPSRIRNLYNKAVEGVRLNPTQRKDFVNRGEKLFKKAEGSFKKNKGEFEKLARKNKIDPTNILREVGLIDQNQFSDISDEKLQRIAGGQ